MEVARRLSHIVLATSTETLWWRGWLPDFLLWSTRSPTWHFLSNRVQLQWCNKRLTDSLLLFRQWMKSSLRCFAKWWHPSTKRTSSQDIPLPLFKYPQSLHPRCTFASNPSTKMHRRSWVLWNGHPLCLPITRCIPSSRQQCQSFRHKVHPSWGRLCGWLQSVLFGCRKLPKSEFLQRPLCQDPESLHRHSRPVKCKPKSNRARFLLCRMAALR